MRHVQPILVAATFKVTLQSHISAHSACISVTKRKLLRSSNHGELAYCVQQEKKRANIQVSYGYLTTTISHKH